MQKMNRKLSFLIVAAIIGLLFLFYFFSGFFELNSPATVVSIILFVIGMLLIIATSPKCEEKALSTIDFIIRYIWFSLISVMIDYLYFPTSPILDLDTGLVNLVVYIVVYSFIVLVSYCIEKKYLDREVKCDLIHCLPPVLSLLFSFLIIYLSEKYLNTFFSKEYFYILSTLVVLIGTGVITWSITKLLTICNKS